MEYDSQYNFQHAPQWRDFNVPSPGSAYQSNFFDEKSEDFTLPENNSVTEISDITEEDDQKSDGSPALENPESPYLSPSSDLETGFMQDLETINMTPIRIVSPRSKNRASNVLQELPLSAIKSNVFATYTQGIIGSSKPRRATCVFNSTVCPSSVDNSKTPGRRVLRMNRSQNFAPPSAKTPAAKAATTPRVHVNKNVMLPNEVEDITKKVGAKVTGDKRTRSAKKRADEQAKENINVNQCPIKTVTSSMANLKLGTTPVTRSAAAKSAKNALAVTPKAVLMEKKAKVVLTRCDAFDKTSPEAGKQVDDSEHAIKREKTPEEGEKKLMKPVRISFDDLEDEKESEDEFEAQLLEGKDLFVVHQMQHPKPQAVRHKKPTFLTNPARRVSIGKKNLRRSSEYVSTAEAIMSYQRNTPDRFRTVGRQRVQLPQAKPQNSRRTVALSPKLRCAARAHRVVPGREAEQVPKKDAPPRPQPKRVAAIQGTSRTIPISPVLHSKARIRRNRVLSQAEREELELEEMRKHQIHARPAPKHILQAPAPLKPVPVKPVTTVRPFVLPEVKKTRRVAPATAGPSKPTAGPSKPTAGPSKPTARPSGQTKCRRTTCLTAVTALVPVANDEMEQAEIKNFDIRTNDKKKITCTVTSGMEDRNKEFLRKKEAKLKALQEEEKKKLTSEFHARPVPPSIKKAPATKSTADKAQKPAATQAKVVPFSFEDRDKKFGKKAEELRKKMAEEEKKHRIFRANPAPVFKPVMVKSRENLKTKSAENLAPKIDQAAGTSQPLGRVQSADNLQAAQINGPFFNPPMASRAQSADNMAGGRRQFLSVADLGDNDKPKSRAEGANPAMPVLKPSLKPLPVELHSDKRARMRREYDEMLRQKAEQEEERRNRERQAQNIREQAEIAELRKKTEVKARPMPMYRPFVLKKSNRPTTEPHSPAWAAKPKH